jgi:hypothetical protein
MEVAAPAWAVLTSLPRKRKDGHGGYYVSCPTSAHSHGDRSAGLHVSLTEIGNVLVYCHAGCDSLEILAAVGLEERSLFLDTPALRSGRSKAARAIDASPDPHLVALRNAEYQACLDGWMAGSRDITEIFVDHIPRQQRTLSPVTRSRRPVTRRRRA